MQKIQQSLCTVLSLCLMLAVVALASCEKAIFSEEESSSPSGNLAVCVYQIEKTDFGSLTRATGNATRAAKAASEVVTRLNFAVYDESGSRIKQINQTSGDKNFGTAAFQLEEGDYFLVVVGHSANGNPTMTTPAKIQFSNSTGYTDTFLCYGEVTIGEDAVNYEVSLDRIVARCSFVLTDETIPSDVRKMQFYYTGGSGAFNAATGLGSVNSKQTVTFDISSPSATTAEGRQFDLYTFLHEQSDNIALKVTALDVSGNTLYERDFDVPMEQNHITWLSGAFFTGSGSSSTSVTSVTVNTDWAGETHLTF
ncbi:MAG: FimB/Mfa2 family fimbrial subunit [Prevotella sp.]|nr:FimB/Mfa2 family fimbrial subunit [Prevotella sp.]